MNTTTYGLLSRSLPADRVFVQLSEEEYRRLLDAKQTIVLALDAEEAFDVLLENFIELEKTCLSIALEEMICASISYSSVHAQRRQVARLLSNTLAACRSYLDFLNHIDAAMRREKTPSQSVTNARHKEYETRIGYRVMEALRTYAQHRGLPVDSITLGGKRDGKYWVHGIQLTMKVSVLRDREEKAKVLRVLAEAEQRGDRLDLLPLLRDYISGIGAVHEGFRHWHDAEVCRAEEVFSSALESIAIACSSTQPVEYCQAVQCLPDGSLCEKSDIFPELVAYRRELATKNSSLANLERRYVTSRDAA